ncbi:hypothetical protein VOLCADRAFT_88646 [Volvox carteri f. nagariensis]|uniref:Uncharacterized protein n=1 Tax=Volvox carteri f. nagariensis TaxID=3068 RepID=D8TPK1_VOLCA|nr:uncharacterized protein VOLCADRAFT_88646 [Volvox carteri f. nagariensis]EFJ50630.1 hypothetical protein VOLCADRAFT_88646 [Volvox carteri f. nagariensis]|eukprot:XP_002948223.1 hypothetical protein VOLCADRAFT_88646 [Volvox carteri f. nagariensis]
MAPPTVRASQTSVPSTQQRQQQQQIDAAEYYGLYKTARTLARSYQAVAHQKDDQVKALTREMEELKLKLQQMEAQQQRLTASYPGCFRYFHTAPASAATTCDTAAAAFTGSKSFCHHWRDLQLCDRLQHVSDVSLPAPAPVAAPTQLVYPEMPMPPPVLAPPPAGGQNLAGMFVRSARSARVAGDAWSARYSEPQPPGLEDAEDADTADASKGKKSKEAKGSITKAFKKLMSKSWRGGRDENPHRQDAGEGGGGAAAVAGTDILDPHQNYHQYSQQQQQHLSYPHTVAHNWGPMEQAPPLSLDSHDLGTGHGVHNPSLLPFAAEPLSMAPPPLALPAAAVTDRSLAAQQQALRPGVKGPLQSQSQVQSPGRVLQFQGSLGRTNPLNSSTSEIIVARNAHSQSQISSAGIGVAAAAARGLHPQASTSTGASSILLPPSAAAPLPLDSRASAFSHSVVGDGGNWGVRVSRSAMGQFAQRLKNSVPAPAMRRSYDGSMDMAAAAVAGVSGLVSSTASVHQSWSSDGAAAAAWAVAGSHPTELPMPPSANSLRPNSVGRSGGVTTSLSSLNFRAAAAQLNHLPPRPAGRATAVSPAAAPAGPNVLPGGHGGVVAAGVGATAIAGSGLTHMIEQGAAPWSGPQAAAPEAAPASIASAEIVIAVRSPVANRTAPAHMTQLSTPVKNFMADAADAAKSTLKPKPPASPIAAAVVAVPSSEAYLEGILGRLKTPSVLLTASTAAQLAAAVQADLDQVQQQPAPPPPPPSPPPPPTTTEMADAVVGAAAVASVSVLHLTADEAVQTESPVKACASQPEQGTAPASTATSSLTPHGGEDDTVLRRDLRRSVGVGWRSKALGYKNAFPSPSFHEKTLPRASMSAGMLQSLASPPPSPPPPLLARCTAMVEESLLAGTPISPQQKSSQAQLEPTAASVDLVPMPASTRVSRTAPASPAVPPVMQVLGRTPTRASSSSAAAAAAELFALDSPKAPAPPSSPRGPGGEDVDELEAVEQRAEAVSLLQSFSPRVRVGTRAAADKTEQSFTNKSEQRAAGGGGGGGSQGGSEDAKAAGAAAFATATKGSRVGDIITSIGTEAAENVTGGAKGGIVEPAEPQQPQMMRRMDMIGEGGRRIAVHNDKKVVEAVGATKTKALPTTKTTATATVNEIVTTTLTATIITTGHVPSTDLDCQPDGEGGTVGALWLAAPVSARTVAASVSVKPARGYGGRYAATVAECDSSSNPSTSRSGACSTEPSPRRQHPTHDTQFRTHDPSDTKVAGCPGADGSATLALASAKLSDVRKTVSSSGVTHETVSAAPISSRTGTLLHVADVALSDYPSARSNPSASARLREREGVSNAHSGGATPSSCRQISLAVAPSPSPPVSASDSSAGSWDPVPSSQRGSSGCAAPRRGIVPSSLAASAATATGPTPAEISQAAGVASGIRHQQLPASSSRPDGGSAMGAQPPPQHLLLLDSSTGGVTPAALRLQQNLTEAANSVLEPIAARKRGAVRRRSLAAGLDAAGDAMKEPASAVGGASAATAAAGATHELSLLAPRNRHRRWWSQGDSENLREDVPSAVADELPARTTVSTSIDAAPVAGTSAAAGNIVPTVVSSHCSDGQAVSRRVTTAMDIKPATSASLEFVLTECQRHHAASVIQSSWRDARAVRSVGAGAEGLLAAASKADKARSVQRQHLEQLQQRQQQLQKRQHARLQHSKSAMTIQRAWRAYMAAKAAAKREEHRRQEPVHQGPGLSPSAATPVLVLLPLSQQQPVCVRLPSARMCSSGGLKRRLFQPVTYSLDGMGRGPLLDASERLRLLRGSMSQSEGGWSGSVNESTAMDAQQPECRRRSASAGGASPALDAPFPQPAFMLPDNADDDIGDVAGPVPVKSAPMAAVRAAILPPAGPAVGGLLATAAAAITAGSSAMPVAAAAPAAGTSTPVTRSPAPPAPPPQPPPPPPQPAHQQQQVRASLDLLSMETAAAALPLPEANSDYSSAATQSWPAGLKISCPPRPHSESTAGVVALASAASPSTQPTTANSPMPPNPLASPTFLFCGDVVTRAGAVHSDLIHGRTRSRVHSSCGSDIRTVDDHDGDDGVRDRPMGRGGVSLISASWDGGRMLLERSGPSLDPKSAVRRSYGDGSNNNAAGGGFMDSLRGIRTDVTLLAQLAGAAMNSCLSSSPARAQQHTPKHQPAPLPPRQPPAPSPPSQGLAAATTMTASITATVTSTAAAIPKYAGADTLPTGLVVSRQPPLNTAISPLGVPLDSFCRIGTEEELAEFEAIEAAVAAAGSRSGSDRSDALPAGPPAVGLSAARALATEFTGDDDDEAPITSSRCLTTTPPTSRLLSCSSSNDEGDDDDDRLMLRIEQCELSSNPAPATAPLEAQEVVQERDFVGREENNDGSLSPLRQTQASDRTPQAYSTSCLAAGIGSPPSISTATTTTTGGDADKLLGVGNAPSPVRWHTSELWEIAHLHPHTPTPLSASHRFDDVLTCAPPPPTPSTPPPLQTAAAAAASTTQPLATASMRLHVLSGDTVNRLKLRAAEPAPLHSSPTLSAASGQCQVAAMPATTKGIAAVATTVTGATTAVAKTTAAAAALTTPAAAAKSIPAAAASATAATAKPGGTTSSLRSSLSKIPSLNTSALSGSAACQSESRAQSQSARSSTTRDASTPLQPQPQQSQPSSASGAMPISAAQSTATTTTTSATTLKGIARSDSQSRAVLTEATNSIAIAATQAATMAAATAAAAAVLSPSLKTQRLISSSSSSGSSNCSSRSGETTATSVNPTSYDSATAVAYIFPKSSINKGDTPAAPVAAGAATASTADGPAALDRRSSAVVGMLCPAPSGTAAAAAAAAMLPVAPAAIGSSGVCSHQERRRYASSPSMISARMTSPMLDGDSDASPRLGLPPHNTLYPSAAPRRLSTGSATASSEGSSPRYAGISSKLPHALSYYQNPYFDIGNGSGGNSMAAQARGLCHRRSSSSPGSLEDMSQGATESGVAAAAVLSGGLAAAAAGSAGVDSAAALCHSSFAGSKRQQADAEAFSLYGGLALSYESSDSEL